MSVKRIYNDRHQFCDGNGIPYSGALLFVYLAASSTRATTYNSSAGSVANTNPLVLDSAGRLQAEVWVTTGSSYKLVLAAAGDGDSITNPSSPIWTEDNITGINDATVAAQDEWVTGPTPTYVSATSFTLAGDQRTAFHVGRRIKTTNSGGTVYSTLTVSAFGALTTLTVVNDSGTLDSGLSAVSYGLLSATNPSSPILTDALFAVSGSVDATKKVKFEVDGLTTATTRVVTVPNRDLSVAGGPSDGQILFPAVQASSADANTLDDYEEGTTTPGLSFGGGTTGITYTTQELKYTKKGREVTCHIFINLSSKGSSNGTAKITGLPFAGSGGTNNHGGGAAQDWVNITTAYLSATVDNGSTAASLKGIASASQVANISDTAFTNTSSFSMTLVYTAAT